VLGDLGVSIVSAIARPRCSVEEAEDAETDSNGERAEVTEFSGLLRNTLRVLGDLGVSIVSAISRPRCSVEEAEDAETDSKRRARRGHGVFWSSSKYSPRPRRPRRFDRLRDLSSPLHVEEAEDAETDSNAERAERSWSVGSPPGG
jgi:hypothetical protein